MAYNPHTKRNKAKHAERQITAYKYALDGYSYQQIADATGISKSTAYNLVNDEIAEGVTEHRDALRRKMHDQNNEDLRIYAEVMASNAPVVNHGKVIRDEAGNPVIDYGLKLSVLDRRNRVYQRQAKLLGLDSPTQVEQTVVHSSPVDDSIMALVEEQNRKANEALGR